jgi:hypothetical protein
VLLQTLGRTEEAQKILVKYKQISDKKKMDLYETFRLVFYYSMQLEKEVLLREINEYLEKFPKNAVVLYLRAMIYLEFSNSTNSANPSGQSSAKKYQNTEFYMKYESDIKEALQIEPHDTEFLIKDGITNENLTKLFFMILPDMDFYQPKPLANYKTAHSGMKVLYVIIKAVKMFKIKVEKKKLKNFYSNKLKIFKKRLENSKSHCDNSDNSNNCSTNNINNPHYNQCEITANNSIANSNINITANNNYPSNTSDIVEVRDSDKDNSNSNINITGSNKISASTALNSNITGTGNANNITNTGLFKNINSYNKSTTGTHNNTNKIASSLASVVSLTTERAERERPSPISAKILVKSPPTIVNIKNNVEKANVDDIITEIKKEYEVKVKSLYKSAWLYNLRLCDGSQYNLEADVDTNFFIKNKYYAPFNLKESLVNGIKQNIEYKNTQRDRSNNVGNFNSSPVPETYRKSIGNVAGIVGAKTKNFKTYSNQNLNKNKVNATKPLINFITKPTEEANFSVSAINPERHNQEQDSMSFSSDINLLDGGVTCKRNEREKEKDIFLRNIAGNGNAINNLKKLEKDK